MEHIATSLVSDPESVEVEIEGGENGEPVRLTLHVGPDDVGRVIGRQGRVAKAIRTVVRSATAHEGYRVSIDIADD
ncbi:MAG: KH domain-containing protein [Acidimicrobiales bacterium]|nr:KH domain-containing protein [Acidimicrobiales bacterium]